MPREVLEQKRRERVTKNQVLYDKSTINLIDAFIEEEYMAFPVSTHDDMLDGLARIADPELHVRWPQSLRPGQVGPASDLLD